MNANATIATSALPAQRQRSGFRLLLVGGYCLAGTLFLALALYGLDYYMLAAAQRPLSPKYDLLKPSGAIGLKLGILGLAMFFAIFLYPIRKRWKWLSRQGSARNWLDAHVLLGLTAPLVIAFHASFKFRGIAGMAFWIMAAVALSGVVGRYLYGQIPRSLNTAELSLKESQEMQQKLMRQLAAQRLILPEQLRPLFRLPSPQRVDEMPAVFALAYMLALDAVRPFHVARLRQRALGWGGGFSTLGGLLPSGNAQIEGVIGVAREQAALAKRILFLSRSQQVFHLWHVVHRPFSYSFAVLACIHVGVVLLLGYM
ncbi:MAG TPA: hypothetical protein VL155_15010 [Terriglobales bacterium]|jgi:hypothetical protein|nr:hypothetical protein [Terriglobales bacterium]